LLPIFPISPPFFKAFRYVHFQNKHFSPQSKLLLGTLASSNIFKFYFFYYIYNFTKTHNKFFFMNTFQLLLHNQMHLQMYFFFKQHKSVIFGIKVLRCSKVFKKVKTLVLKKAKKC
jgi:hypothetical protein